MVAHNHGMETWIGDRPPKKLSNEHFSTKKYDHTTTSVFESCNNVLKGCKGMTNNTLVEYTRQRMTTWYNNRHRAIEEWNSFLTPYTQVLVTKMKKGSRNFLSPWLTLMCFSWILLNIRMWLTWRRGSPCFHAMTPIDYRKLDIHTYIEHQYEEVMYSLTYRELIRPTLDRMQCPMASNLVPHVLLLLNRRGVGRPRKRH